MRKTFEFFFVATILVLSLILSGHLSKKLSLKKKTNLSDKSEGFNFLRKNNKPSEKLINIYLRSNILKLKTRSNLYLVNLDSHITNSNGELKYLESGIQSNFSQTCDSCSVYLTHRGKFKSYILNCHCDNLDGESVSSELNLKNIIKLTLK